MKIKVNIINQIVEYFENNEDVFNDCIEELDIYNGFLNEDRYYAMEELPEILCGLDPIDLLNRAYFGRDEESWHTDSRGDKIYDSFNPNREYFKFNAYGNLVSANYKDYSAYNYCYAVESMAENRNDIYSIDSNEELKALFDKLKSDEEQEEE